MSMVGLVPVMLVLLSVPITCSSTDLLAQSLSPTPSVQIDEDLLWFHIL